MRPPRCDCSRRKLLNRSSRRKEVGGQVPNLELRDGLVYLTGTDATVPLAAIDIPGTGIAKPAGRSCGFMVVCRLGTREP